MEEITLLKTRVNGATPAAAADPNLNPPRLGALPLSLKLTLTLTLP